MKHRKRGREEGKEKLRNRAVEGRSRSKREEW